MPTADPQWLRMPAFNQVVYANDPFPDPNFQVNQRVSYPDGSVYELRNGTWVQIQAPGRAGMMLHIERLKLQPGTGPKEALAEELLLSKLSPEQQADYRNRHRFTVIGQSGQDYEIDCTGGASGNVWATIRPIITHPQFNPSPLTLTPFTGYGRVSFCIHLAFYVTPRNYWPLADHWLAQAMLLRLDEQKFLRIAIATQF